MPSSLTNLPPAALEHVALYFRTLSEPTRLRILNALGSRKLSVGEIANEVDSSAANVSRHLSQLARHGLVSREHHGTSVYYRISDPVVPELCELVCTSIANRLEQATAAGVAFSAALVQAPPARQPPDAGTS